MRLFLGVLRFLITAAAVPLCGYLMDGVQVLEYPNAIVVGLILAVIYTVFRPLLRMLLSVVNFCTLGLLNAALDAWLVWTVASYVQNSIAFTNYWWALAVALAINAVRMVLDVLSGHR